MTIAVDDDSLPPGALVLAANADPATLADRLERASLVAVQIESFVDGRALSLARLLRERLGYRGELRAIGDVVRDQIAFLARCGFDSFALRADQDPAGAIAALAEMSVAYQGDAREPRPFFARRSGAA